ncbi:MAG: hypothetical protein ABL891_23030, partial [Burkholderiales bacterium]
FLYTFRKRVAASMLGVLALGGCATIEESWRGDGLAEQPAVRQCAAHFIALNAAVERAGVRDAEAMRISGFPYLRVDRFSASLRNVNVMGSDDKAYVQWLLRLQALDQAARRVEISNLPESEIRALQRDSGGRAALLDQTGRCADLLREQDRMLPERAEVIRARAQVPDDYVTWQRVVGLYGLTNIPFSRGIALWHSEALRDFQNAPEGRQPAQPLMRYAIADETAATREQVAAILRRASNNPLRIPEFNDNERAVLLSAFAPVFEVETGGDYDRVGRLRWGSSATLQVDTTVPVVYHRIAFARYGDRTLTQLVYSVWFSERPADHPLDVLAGRLDGVVIRVTLDPEGDPLVYDSIHPCGCYHMFFPTPRVQALPAPEGVGEWAFVPAMLPAHTVGARIAVRIATRSHYLVGVALDKSGGTHSYTLLPENDLRTLPLSENESLPQQVTRSIYAPDGLVPGTARAERLLFWPMGIPSAGAMRQWGHHATAFVGRRHFDDADLIEKRFRVVAP